ncbi:hypothetical protein MUK42_01728, partial [Musa troglodytarum]
GLCPSFLGKALEVVTDFGTSSQGEGKSRADKIVTCSNKDAHCEENSRVLHWPTSEGIETNEVMHRYHLLDGILGSSPAGGSSSGARCGWKRRRQELYRWVIRRVHESTSSSLASFRGSKRYSWMISMKYACQIKTATL